MGDEGQSTTTRRRFIQGGAAAVTLAGLTREPTAAAALGAPEIWKRPARPWGQGNRRPNFLIITVDEQRFPPPYESAQLAAFRAQYLTTQQTLQQTGISFRRHYAAATACAPSRTSIYTGQYPSLHGVSQVDGAAKGAVEPDMFWLDPTTVPTLGNYFLHAGYRTFYRGKWHISFADIIEPGTTNGGWDGLASYGLLGQRDPSTEELYEHAERLSRYGFSAWIGREPHGANPLDSGSSAGIYKPTGQRCFSRDQAFAGQTVELLQRLEADPDHSPWVLVCSFVNPHDITLWGLFTRLGNLFPQIQYTFDFTVGPEVPSFANLFDQAMFQRTNREDLSTKPRAQESYRDSYAQWVQPTLGPDYFRFYYQLQRNVDNEMARVYDALRRSRFFEDTIVVFTSDHGDLLGSHGNMHQKWYTAYEETTHVPLIISNPNLATKGQSVDIPTSHIDLVPTLLGLAGLDPEPLRRALSSDHTEARPLVGRDLSGLVQGTGHPTTLQTPIYFMTDDDTARGIQQSANFIGLTAAVVQPSHLDTVVVLRGNELWKYTEYRDDPQFWTTPNTQDILSQPNLPPPQQPGTYTRPFTVTLKTQPVPPQARDYELYNVTADPLELRNLALDAAFNDRKAEMAALLQEQRQRKRLTPQTTSASGRAANEKGEGWQPAAATPAP
ncbi:MAG TPA: sulfatase-like hydrolase/transferase [Chloroflexota bacterium]|nr:sulfatase-like hydrolase/transferase [Chloroflexota bacterium]